MQRERGAHQQPGGERGTSGAQARGEPAAGKQPQARRQRQRQPDPVGVFEHERRQVAHTRFGPGGHLLCVVRIRQPEAVAQPFATARARPGSAAGAPGAIACAETPPLAAARTTRMTAVAAANSRPSGRASASRPALSESQASELLLPALNTAIATQASSRKPKSAVSSPELVQARKVRLLTTPSSTSASSVVRQGASPGESRSRSTITTTSARLASEKNSASRFAASGGSTPKPRQTPSSSATHSKLV